MANTGNRRPAPQASKRAESDSVLDVELVAMLDELLSAEERDRILRQAEEQLTLIVADLHRAWTDGDTAATGREAHKLAGLAGTAGCVMVLRIARAIEGTAGTTARDDVDRHFAELSHAVPAAIQALRGWREGKRA